jgi:hypothetical protein
MPIPQGKVVVLGDELDNDTKHTFTVSAVEAGDTINVTPIRSAMIKVGSAGFIPVAEWPLTGKLEKFWRTREPARGFVIHPGETVNVLYVARVKNPARKASLGPIVINYTDNANNTKYSAAGAVHFILQTHKCP